MSCAFSPNRAKSPTLITTDELLKLILTKVNGLESNMGQVITNINTSADENDSSMLEIKKIGKSLRFKGEIVTDDSRDNADIREDESKDYALQSQHSIGKERRIALKIEEKAAVKIYIMNLRDEISGQVRPMKPENLNEALQGALETTSTLRPQEDIIPFKAPNSPMLR